VVAWVGALGREGRFGGDVVRDVSDPAVSDPDAVGGGGVASLVDVCIG